MGILSHPYNEVFDIVLFLSIVPSFGFNDIGKADGNQTPTTQGRNTNSYYSPSSNRYYMSPNHPY